MPSADAAREALRFEATMRSVRPSARALVGYVIVCYALTYALDGVVLRTGDPMNSPLRWLLFLSGWTPALAAVAFRLLGRDGFADVGWGLKRPASVLLVGVPPVVWALAVGLVSVAGPISIAAGPAGVLVRRVGVALIANGLFLFGEEFGWRGYLQDRVVDSLGRTRGLLVMCLIWSFWHLPLDLMGLGYPGVPVGLAALVLRPMAFLGIGLLVAIAYDRTRSIWVACLVHSANNTAGALPGLEPTAGQGTAILVAVTLLSFVLGLVVLFVLWRRESHFRPVPNAGAVGSGDGA